MKKNELIGGCQHRKISQTLCHGKERDTMRVAPMLVNARSEKDALETVNRDPVQRRGV